MNTVDNLYFEVWSTPNYNDSKMISMHAELPEDSDLRCISFFFTKDDFEKFVKSDWDTIVDITHRCYVCGDLAVFYDFDVPRVSYGKMELPYYSMNFPQFVRRVILRAANKIWKTNSEDRVRINIDDKKLARWVNQYGRASGRVELELASEATEDLFYEAKSKSSNFEDNIEKLMTIAKNGTNCFYHTGKVRLLKDTYMDSFTFNIISPKGRSTMFGGLINHGRNGDADWSIHT